MGDVFMTRLERKIAGSIALLQKAEKLALQYSPDGFNVAFSGGKDSQVIYELCKIGGVKFKAVMQVTTIDPPELMKFVRKNYPDVIMDRPEINFYKLIVKEKSLPTQNIRFCCKHLKEQSGAGTVTVLGIRKAESVRRQRRNEFEVRRKRDFIYSSTLDQFNIDNETMIVCLNGKDKIMLSPIINWSNSDIWSFIRKRNLDYCQLYDHGYHRIGCILCPMQSKKQKQMDIVRYPGVVREIKKSIQKLIDIGKYSTLGNADDVFDWWVSGVSEKKFLAEKNQCKIEL